MTLMKPVVAWTAIVAWFYYVQIPIFQKLRKIISSYSPFTLLLAGSCGAIVATCGAIHILKSRKIKGKKKKEETFKANQVEHPSFPHVAPGKGAPLLTGVRVVELATVVAGPSAGRIFADHGAEVVRVEAPSGDPWRRQFKNVFERDRKSFVSSFEHVNFNKSCVMIDITTVDGLRQIKELIAEADVFITNVRLPALQRRGLDYASIKDEFPHIVYAQLSAWGLVGRKF